MLKLKSKIFMLDDLQFNGFFALLLIRKLENQSFETYIKLRESLVKKIISKLLRPGSLINVIFT